ncbi:MAG: SDR family oxidoreductase [Planctomycetaceae bacterium]|nr:SDR family oxidoreductase [Planctomycetaceae bacterium]
MELRDKVIVVTGAARGIGLGLCKRFAQESPQAIVMSDLECSSIVAAAESVGGEAVTCDVSLEEQVQRLVNDTLDKHGRIDLFCANAGIVLSGGVHASNDEWQRVMDVNFTSHLYSTRAVLPSMLERGEGCLMHTASAAGLLTSIGSASYAVSKHAAVAFAEWVSITYGNRGIQVACLCPQGVDTDMIKGGDPLSQFLQQQALSTEQVAEDVVTALREKRFLILPHGEVSRFLQNRASDHERWLKGMRKINRELLGGHDSIGDVEP